MNKSTEENIAGSEGLINKNKPNNMGQKSTSRIWIALAVIFLAVSLGLSAYIIYIKVFEKQDTNEKAEILLKYGIFFRTPEEQKIFEAQYLSTMTAPEITPAQVTEDPQLRSCSFNCPYGNLTRARRSPLVDTITAFNTVHLMQKRDVRTPMGSRVYHGCCISRHYFYSPDVIANKDGVNVTVIQYNNNRQYFPTQECKHAIGCTGCGCAQETSLFTAVVKNKQRETNPSAPEYILDLIKLPGCCKCFNNLTPPV